MLMLTDTVRRLLMNSPGDPLCDSCLAFACSSSLVEVRPITESLVTTANFQRRERCESCRRSVPAIAYLGKCAHCSYSIGRDDAVVVVGDNTVHTVCRRMLASEETIRSSRDLARQSRRLIDDARRQIGKKPTAPPPGVASMDADIVRRILMDAPGDALCERCVSGVANLSLETVRVVVASLLSSGAEFERASTCAGCHRSPSIVYRAKCAHCSVRLPDGDKGFRMGEELFHLACLRKLISDDSIRLSRALGRRSRRLIEESRRRTRQGHEGPPLESP